MAERYYNLRMEGDVIKTKLNQIDAKLDVINGNAENLKVNITSEVSNKKFAANQEYVDNTLSTYVVLNSGNLKVGGTEINLDSTYLHNIGDKKIVLANDNQIPFGEAGQVLTSTGNTGAPVWSNAKAITIEEVAEDDSDEDNLNGIASITVDEIDDHKLIITKESFIKNSDLEDIESPIRVALNKKVNADDLYGDTALLIGKTNYIYRLAVKAEDENKILKVIKDENDLIRINWEEEKSLQLVIVDDDSSDDLPEDAASVISGLHYEQPNLYLYKEDTVNYSAYKAFETSTIDLLANAATKNELDLKADKEELGDQFTMEFDSSTKTLTIIKK